MWARCAILLLALAAVVTSLQPLTLRAYPAVSFAPATVRLRIHVTPHTLNRWLGWICDSGDYTTAESELRINGEDGPILFVRDLRDLWPGTYECRAIVTRSNGSTVSATTSFRIIGHN
jgi:hypothetical protein